ncbi:MAG: hypothetical protein LBF27_29335 [Sphingobacterium sp.]|jgi:hypothetical protein|nr:hypothetical protein [Sphingobacterium sp.]
MKRGFSPLFDDDASRLEQQHLTVSDSSERYMATVANSNTVKRLKLHWPIGHSMRYGVRLEMYLKERKYEVKYEIDLIRLANTDENLNCFSIDRSKELFINEMEPDLMVDQLAHEVSNVLYPMEIVVDFEGRFSEIQNLTQIQKRWVKLKSELKSKYEGNIVESYFSRMENCIFDPFLLNSAIKQQDWFLNVFFQPIYSNYNGLEAKDLHVHFPIIPFHNVAYSSKLKLLSELSDLGMIEVLATGFIDSEIYGHELGGEYHSRYMLHPHTKQIWLSKSDWSVIQNDEIRYIKLDLFCIANNGDELDFDFVKQNSASDQRSDANKKKESIWKKLIKM